MSNTGPATLLDPGLLATRQVPAPMQHQLPMLDLPDAWLALLVSGHLPACSLGTLFQSCRQLRDLVLQLAPVGPTLHVELAEQTLPGAARRMQLANTSSQWALHVTWPGYWSNDPQTRAHGTTIFYSLISNRSVLHNLTEVHLVMLELPTVLPQQLSQSCPNLTSLTLEYCKILWGKANAASFTGSFSQLCSLNLFCTDFDKHQVLWDSQLRQQVQQLTHLQHLQLISDDFTDWFAGDEEVRGWWAISQAVVAHQLTHLAVAVDAEDLRPELHWLQPQWAARLTALQHLELKDSVLSDGDLRVLLGLPQLTHLAVKATALTTSFKGQPCQWRELALRTAHAAQLARLPLHQDLQLELVGERHLELGTDPHVAVMAACNVQNSKGIIAAHDEYVTIGTEWASLPQQQRAALAWRQVLTATGMVRSTCLALECFDLNLWEARVLAHKVCALCEARGTHCLTALRLEKSCTWAVGPLLDLLLAMPPPPDFHLTL